MCTHKPTHKHGVFTYHNKEDKYNSVFWLIKKFFCIICIGKYFSFVLIYKFLKWWLDVGKYYQVANFFHMCCKMSGLCKFPCAIINMKYSLNQQGLLHPLVMSFCNGILWVLYYLFQSNHFMSNQQVLWILF